MQYNFPGDLDYRHISDHWHIFKAMSNSQNFNQNWDLELIFFSEAWFKHTHDAAWSQFNHYIMTQTWQQSNYVIDRVSFALGWTSFIEAVTRRKLHPSPYLTDTIKHLFLLAAGSVPGIAPVTNSICLCAKNIIAHYISTLTYHAIKFEIFMSRDFDIVLLYLLQSLLRLTINPIFTNVSRYTAE